MIFLPVSSIGLALTVVCAALLSGIADWLVDLFIYTDHAVEFSFRRLHCDVYEDTNPTHRGLACTIW